MRKLPKMTTQQNQTKNIIVYSKNNCVYCGKAKTLISNLGLDYTEKKLEEFDSPQAMIKDIGKNVRSMPQIKIDGELIGGYNQLIEYFVDKGKVDFKGNIKK